MNHRYHVNPATGRPNICRAKTPEGCLYYDKETNREAPHFDTKEEARKYSETKLNEEYKNINKNTISKNDKISYSFLKKFEELEKEYSDFPNKFLKKNLRVMGAKRFLTPIENDSTVQEIIKKSIEEFRKKTPNANISDEELKEKVLSLNASYGAKQKMYPFITTVVTEPKEHGISDNDTEKYAQNLGIKNLKRFEDTVGLGKRYGDIVYTGEIENKDKNGNITVETVFISDAPLNSKNFTKRYFKNSALQKRLGLKGYSTWLDRRSLSGANKILKHTNENILKDNDLKFSKYERIVNKLEEKQDSAQNFQYQKAYVKENQDTIATVWDTKKNPDKIHQKLMQETSLNKVFKSVEIDNDVSIEEYKKFEKDYHDVEHLLPKIPDDKKPNFKLRFLGKHRATGIFSVLHNTIAIDVRDSGSTIHELAHYYDFMLKDSISLSPEFSEIKKEYAKNLKMPKDISANSKYNASYYNTNTEVHSRLFEIWASERKGINNKLIDKEKFKNFDYAPIMNNPELKKKGFAFLDKIYG